MPSFGFFSQLLQKTNSIITKEASEHVIWKAQDHLNPTRLYARFWLGALLVGRYALDDDLLLLEEPHEGFGAFVV